MWKIQASENPYSRVFYEVFGKGRLDLYHQQFIRWIYYFLFHKKNLFKSQEERKYNYWIENPSNLVGFRWVILYITVECKENNKTMFKACTINLHIGLWFSGSATLAVFTSKLVRFSSPRTNPHTKTKVKMKTIFISVSN